MSDNKKFDDIIERLAKNWGITPETSGDLSILEIPFKGKTYPLCFSPLDDDFALIVTQAIEDVSPLSSETCFEILKSNSMLNSSLSVFFIHENKAVSDALPLLYQALFPYSQFSIPEAVKYIESYLEQYANSMERIEGSMHPGSRSKGAKSDKPAAPLASKEFAGLKI